MTSFHLKIIASISMTIDHIAKIIGQSGLLALFPTLSIKSAFYICHAMSVIGRIAFPIFAFTLAVGASKTHNIYKYILRLVIFALISEPIFLIAFSPHSAALLTHPVNHITTTNVLYTLAFGLTIIHIYKRANLHSTLRKKLPNYIAIVITAYIAAYLDVDYSAEGVILILLLYIANTKLKTVIVIHLWSFWLYILVPVFTGSSLDFFQITEYIGSVASCLPIWFYNDKRGQSIKWIFYLYYPVHLICLIVMRSFHT